MSAPLAGGRSLVGLLFRLSLFVLVVVAIVIVIIAALAGKPDSANELNLNPPREREVGPLAHDVGTLGLGPGALRPATSGTYVIVGASGFIDGVVCSKVAPCP